MSTLSLGSSCLVTLRKGCLRCLERTAPIPILQRFSQRPGLSITPLLNILTVSLM